MKGIAARHRPAAADRPLPTYLYEAATPRTLTTPRHFAYVKVAEGCDYNCSFCIIRPCAGRTAAAGPTTSSVRLDSWQTAA